MHLWNAHLFPWNYTLLCSRKLSSSRLYKLTIYSCLEYSVLFFTPTSNTLWLYGLWMHVHTHTCVCMLTHTHTHIFKNRLYLSSDSETEAKDNTISCCNQDNNTNAWDQCLQEDKLWYNSSMFGNVRKIKYTHT